MIITLIFMVSPDHMAISWRVCSHLHEEYITMTVVVIPVTIEQRTPVSLPTQAPPIDLQHHTRHLNIKIMISTMAHEDNVISIDVNVDTTTSTEPLNIYNVK